MMLKKQQILFYCLVISLTLSTVTLFAAEDVSSYLILSDISPYKRLTQAYDAYSHKLKTIPGYSAYNGAGLLAGADHFLLDHSDMTYETTYQSEELDMGMSVHVTKHSDPPDSLRWLLHELDAGFRDKYGIPAVSYYPWEVDSQTVLINAVGGREYRWLSGNKVVVIEYHGSLTQLPEPVEVVKAYLTKHASTLSPTTLSQLRSAANKTTWIKDEMDRRLWLCDKWFYQLQLGKVQQADAFQAAVKSMTIFLDYREKYCGIKAADEKNLLASYLNANNGTGIKAKLDEYKKWWTVNKDKAINL